MELDYAPFKELLLKMKEEIKESTKEEIDKSLQTEQAADELDIAASDTNAALAKRLLERQYSYIKRIDVALDKIKEGTYGECEMCGDMIAPKRLLARPIALLCVLCKEKEEKKEKWERGPRGIMSEESGDEVK
jgi:DnaK suppressor protein